MVLGVKKEDLTPWSNRPQMNRPPLKHVFPCTERKSTLLRVSCGRVEGIKKSKKARKGTTSPICPPHPPFLAATIFCMWGRTVDVIKRTRCQVNQFSGFRAPGAENDPPIDLAHRPNNSVRTNVLHCDDSKKKNTPKDWM